jgi:hypothetical protein
LEAQSYTLHGQVLARYLVEEFKMEVYRLEQRKRRLLEDIESTWRLKRRALWIKKGDENTMFFHQFANH